MWIKRVLSPLITALLLAGAGGAEEECSMCNAKVAKKLKDAGDWCDKHERAKSQCYICDPSLLEKAKYGKDMPTPKGNMPEKK